MAAGLSLAPDKLTAFQSAFEAEARLRLSRSQLQAVIESDGEVAANHLTLETAQLIQAAGPGGRRSPSLSLMAGSCCVNSADLVASI